MSDHFPDKTILGNKIGVFDSGLGGLTVLKNLLEILPDHDYLYLGDNARVPYGGKSQETIFGYTKQAVGYLFEKGCRLIIIACNTASSQALRRLQQEWLPSEYPDRRILGVIRPLAEAAASHEGSRRIGIIGTEATIASGAYEREIKNLNPGLEIYSQAAPLLVPLIEAGWEERPETETIIADYISSLTARSIDTLILACTHYPFLQKKIEEAAGPNVWIPDTGKIVAESLARYIERHPELKLSGTSAKERVFLTTDDPERFRRLGGRFLQEGIEKVEKINL